MTKLYCNICGDFIIGIFLYGSYARGDNKEDSDIDIVAIVKGERICLQNKLKDIWDKTAEISLENDIVVSLMVIPYDEFEACKEVHAYYKNIAEEGIRIG